MLDSSVYAHRLCISTVPGKIIDKSRAENNGRDEMSIHFAVAQAQFNAQEPEADYSSPQI